MKVKTKGLWEKAKKQGIPVEKYLESLEVDGGFFATDYLHGFCNMFALKLHKTYGYGMCICTSKETDEKEQMMVHTYCVYGGWYIDARGCTNNKALFFEEFGGIENLNIDIAVPEPQLDNCTFYEKLTYDLSDKLLKMSKEYGYPTSICLKLPEITVDKTTDDFVDLPKNPNSSIETLNIEEKENEQIFVER